MGVRSGVINPTTKMSAGSGSRPTGTDGSDFHHRERVAEHYEKSVKLKNRLKNIIYLQILCALLALYVGVLHEDWTSLMTTIGYAIALPAGWRALSKNNKDFINIYGVACSMLGIFPMAFVLYRFLWTNVIVADRYRYIWSTAIILDRSLYLVEAVVIIGVNGVGLYHAKALMKAWEGSSKTRKKRY